MKRRLFVVSSLVLLGLVTFACVVFWPFVTIALAWSNRDPSYWSRMLHEDRNRTKRIAATEKLRELYVDNTEVVVVAWARALREEPDPQLRAHIAFLLRGAREDAKPVIPALAEAVQDEDENVRLEVVHALEEFGPEARVAIPYLKEALKNRDPRISGQAADALKKIDPEAGAKAGTK
jgi:HEAT repeat protein